MENDCCSQLKSILSKYPHVHQFLNEGYIRKQCKQKPKSFLLQRLADSIREEKVSELEQHLASLEARLLSLASVKGYCKLRPSLKKPDWDDYYAFLAQVDASLWFKDRITIKEVEPDLYNTQGKCIGSSDILISFSQQDIYCEVTSFESLAKALESKSRESDETKIQSIVAREPWLGRLEIKDDFRAHRIAKRLLAKTNNQLPKNHPGILILQTGKSVDFHFTIAKVATTLFQKKKGVALRPQLVLIMLWSLGRGSQMGEAPFWFVNDNSPFRDIGRKLLKCLGQENKILDCRNYITSSL